MSERNVILEIIKKNNINFFNYLKNKNIIQLVRYMIKKDVFKKKNYVCFNNFKKLKNLLINNFKIIRKEKLTYKVERKLV